MTARRVPRWSEVRPLLRRRRTALNPTDRRLAGVASIADLQVLARRRAPRAVSDYVDGGAGDELALRRSREVFQRVEFIPQVLQDVSAVDTSTVILGQRAAVPFVFAPTGFTRMMHTDGESAVARVAERVGIPYALSTMGTTSIEGLSAAAPGGRHWFQLYLWRDRAASRDFVARAAAAGYEALVLTVDTPIAGPRLRDVRNGLTIPPSLSLKTFAEGALHPAWWFDLFTTEPLEFASLTRFEGTVAELSAACSTRLRRSPTWRGSAPSGTDRSWSRASSPRPMPGPSSTRERMASWCRTMGDDSSTGPSHRWRRCPSVVDAVGDRAEVYVDGGVRSGSDVVAAVALGATAALVGRAYLYGLMAGGERGVGRAADILVHEVASTLALLGVPRVSDLRAITCGCACRLQ